MLILGGGSIGVHGITFNFSTHVNIFIIKVRNNKLDYWEMDEEGVGPEPDLRVELIY